MEEFDQLSFNTLDRYYSVLKYKGYVKDEDVIRVFLIIFISKLLHDNAEYVSEDDYKKIDEILTCMYGKSCLIPYIPYLKSISPVYTYLLMLNSSSNEKRIASSDSLSSRLVSL